MARTTITKITPAATGYNLTDSTSFTTLSTGAGNGVTFDYETNTMIFLKANTNTCNFTFKVPTPAAFSEKGSTPPDVTVTLAASKTWFYRASGIFKQSDGDVYVDCDEAADLLVVAL